MSEEEKAIVRSCLDQVTIGMTEARAVPAFWALLGETNRGEWKLFAAAVSAYRRKLSE